MPNSAISKQPKSFHEIAQDSDMGRYFDKLQNGAVNFGKNLEEYQKALESHSFELIEKCCNKTFDSMQQDFFENLLSMGSKDDTVVKELKNKDLQETYNNFFNLIKQFCGKLKKIDGSIFSFPLEFQALDDINEKYDINKYEELKKKYREVYKPWETAFRSWDQNYVRKLTDIISNISESKLDKPLASESEAKQTLESSLDTIIELQIKLQKSVGGIILQTSKWLEDINLQMKKQNTPKPPEKKKSFLKRLFSRKKSASPPPLDFKNFKVFPSGKPIPDDVRQCGIEDCFLMSVLITLAQNNPEAIRACFLQSDNEIEKAHIIKIRLHTVILENDSPQNANDNDNVKLTVEKNGSKGFYSKIKLEPSKPYIIDVSRENLRVQGLSKTKALWPLILQDAYAEFRKKYYETLIRDSDETTINLAKSLTNSKDISKLLYQGYDSLAYVVITGKPSKETYGTDSKKLIKNIEKNQNTSSTCSFLNKVFIKDTETKEKVQLHTSHIYAITDVNPIKKAITIQDPNRVWGAKGKEGSFTMSFKDFDKYVEGVTFSEK